MESESGGGSALCDLTHLTIPILGRVPSAAADATCFLLLQGHGAEDGTVTGGRVACE